MKLGLIVEGHGEVAAAPILLRRLAAELGVHSVAIPAPLRVSRGKLAKREEVERGVELMARKVGPAGPILVLLDADLDCPADLGPQIHSWASAIRSDREIGVVLAVREFESWFLAAASSLRGLRGLPQDLAPPAHPEAISNAKGWLAAKMPTGYSETVDQPAFAAAFDLSAADATSSFRKLRRDVARLFGVPAPNEAANK